MQVHEIKVGLHGPQPALADLLLLRLLVNFYTRAHTIIYVGNS
jgi:hypothetical protein